MKNEVIHFSPKYQSQKKEIDKFFASFKSFEHLEIVECFMGAKSLKYPEYTEIVIKVKKGDKETTLALWRDE